MRRRILPRPHVRRSSGHTPAMGAGPRPLEVPLSEVIGAMSYALDLTEGEPPGHAVRTCMIGMRLAQELGHRRGRGGRPLLRAAAQGCRLLGELGPDGGAVRGRRSPRQAQLQARRLGALLHRVPVDAADGRARRFAAPRAAQLLSISEETEITRSLMRARCERGAEIARLLGLGPGRRRRSARSTSTGTATASPRACAARRSRSGADPVPGADGGDLPRRARARRGAAVAAGAAAAGSTRALVAALGDARRHRVLALAARRRVRAVGAAGAAADGRRGLPGPDRRRVRRRGRREVAVDLPPLRSHLRDRDEHRGAARLRGRRAAATYAGRRCCTTSASSRSPTGSSTSPRG